MVARIKKNDTVFVLSGKDKGKTGSVIEISSKADKVLVKGISLATHHAKARRQGDVAGIKQEESYIAISKVMPVCSSCKKACRINVVAHGNGSARSCNLCNQTF